MPKLSDIGSRTTIEDLFAYYVKHEADELGIRGDEANAVIELFKIWKKDVLEEDKRTLFKDVSIKYGIPPKRVAETFIAAFSSFYDKIKQRKDK